MSEQSDVGNWLCKPLDIIQNLYEKYGKESDNHVRRYFDDKINHESSLALIPSLNDVTPQDIQGGCLVRYRCMVQDMYDTEFYQSAYEVAKKSDNSLSMMNGKYRDIMCCLEDFQLKLESENNEISDRLTLYCVPIPGESQWTKHMYKENGPATTTPTTQPNSTCKRNIDSCHSDPADDKCNGSAMDSDESSDGKKLCNNKGSKDHTKDHTKPPPDLNFPLPNETGFPCLVKVYNEHDKIKVNDMVEFIGVFSADPSLAIHEQDAMESEDYLNPIPDAFPEETEAKSPPPSLVPRLHAILSRPLKHNNPLVDKKTDIEDVKAKAFETKRKLLGILEHALFGDHLAAEYMLCHLLSSVYSRADVLSLGKFCLNLINSPRTPQYARLLHHLVSNLTTQSHMLEMSLTTMNKAPFAPYKDYKQNRLCSGVLQLCEGTHLILNETALQPGQLDVQGVKNVTALGTLITWQKVEYDFSYHRQAFTSDVQVLILSEGTSLLPADFRVPLAPLCDPTDLTQYFSEIDSRLTPETLNEIRQYLTIMKGVPFTMDEQVQKMIQDDFVDARKTNPDAMTVDDFHSLLNLVRLLSLCEGSCTGNLELWKKAKQMESDRKQRVLLLPTPQSNPLNQ